jgi:hypothetical protein
VFALVLYPLILDANNSSFSGYFQEYSAGYGWAYYILIPATILAIIAIAVHAFDVFSRMRSGYHGI